MKKAMVMILTALLCVVAFAGCTETDPVHADGSEDAVSKSAVEYSEDTSSSEETFDQTSNDQDPSGTSPVGGFFAGEKVGQVEIDGGTFLVKQTKHTYRQSDLILLYVENQSGKDYAVTISGTYLDESGNVIKTEEQTFDQFYADYKNYFIFYPDTVFADFTYTFSFGEVKKLSNNHPKSQDKDIRVTDFEYKFLRLEEGKDVIRKLLIENEDYTRYPSIIAYLTCSNHTTFKRVPFLEIILYNANGEIISIVSRAPLLGCEQPFGNGEPFPIYQTTKDTLEWPEKYLGEISAIVSVRSIDTYPTLLEHAPDRFSSEEYGTEFDFAD